MVEKFSSEARDLGQLFCEDDQQDIIRLLLEFLFMGWLRDLVRFFPLLVAPRPILSFSLASKSVCVTLYPFLSASHSDEINAWAIDWVFYAYL